MYVCGIGAGPPLPSSSDVVPHAVDDRPLERLSVAELNDLLHRADGDLVAFVDFRIAGTCAEIAAAAAKLTADGKDAAAVLVYADADAARDWQRYPPRLASLVRPVAANAAVLVRKSVVDVHGRLADVSDPLWEWVVRAAGDGLTVEAFHSPTETPRGTVQTLPRLVPREPGRSRRWLLDAIRAARPEELVERVASPPDAVAVRAGVLQIHDFLDASHADAQSVEHQGRHASGDYWHAIMHRREPDYGNAKYWFRHVGTHPIHADLGRAADAVITRLADDGAAALKEQLGTPGGWDPFAFVDFCAECQRGGDAHRTRIAEAIQWREMLLLLEQSYRDATGA